MNSWFIRNKHWRSKSLFSVLFLISYSYITNLYTVNHTSFLISPICYAAVQLPQPWSTLCLRGNQMPHNPKRNLSVLEVDLILLLEDLNGWNVSRFPSVFCSLFYQMSLKTTSNLFHTQLLSKRLKHPAHRSVCSYFVISATYMEYLTQLNASNTAWVLLLGGKNTGKSTRNIAHLYNRILWR
jgi:hypothetical protein